MTRAVACHAAAAKLVARPPTPTHGRNYAAAEDALRKIRLVASGALGGSPNAYNVDNGRVSGPGGSMSFAQVAERAIAIGRGVRW